MGPGCRSGSKKVVGMGGGWSGKDELHFNLGIGIRWSCEV